MTMVTIEAAFYRNQIIVGTFELLQDFKKFNTKSGGFLQIILNGKKSRIAVESENIGYVICKETKVKKPEVTISCDEPESSVKAKITMWPHSYDVAAKKLNITKAVLLKQIEDKIVKSFLHNGTFKVSLPIR